MSPRRDSLGEWSHLTGLSTCPGQDWSKLTGRDGEDSRARARKDCLMDDTCEWVWMCTGCREGGADR